MTDEEKYLFDLRGYVVVENAIPRDEIDAMNSMLDERIAAEVDPEEGRHRFGNVVRWGGPYQSLIDHPGIAPYIAETCGERFRLDHTYLDIIRSGKGPIGTSLHGAELFDPGQFYVFRGGKMHNGLVAVAVNLHDVGPGDGGFAAVPGSHKANYRFPSYWRELETAPDCVERVTGPAGTAIIFTEAMTHGTLPWTAAHERRTVFYKYSPHSMSWAASYYDADSFDELTDRQREILEPPNARYGDRKNGMF